MQVEVTTILDIAARGDRDALALMRDEFLDEARQPESAFLIFDLWAQAELLARFCASHGNPCDKVTLATILLVRRGQVAELGCRAQAGALEAEAHQIMAEVVAGGDIEAIALLTAHIELRADVDDPSALPFLTNLMDKLDRETAAKVSGLVHARKKAMEAAR